MDQNEEFVYGLRVAPKCSCGKPMSQNRIILGEDGNLRFIGTCGDCEEITTFLNVYKAVAKIKGWKESHPRGSGQEPESRKDKTETIPNPDIPSSKYSEIEELERWFKLNPEET